MARGVAGAADVTEAFIDVVDQALAGKSNAKAITSALNSARARFDGRAFAEAVETELVMGLMLGALDAAFEVDEDVTIEPTAFSGRLCLGARFVEADRKFASRPLEQAIRAFLKRDVVTRDVFDKMAVEAKRRAFTVAGMASTAMIDTVKSELANVIDAGSDLRDFREFARTRLEGAGWTPASPSHVETIFRTNVMEAYNGGRHRQMSQPTVVALRPYWQVLNPNDGPPRQRKTHQECYLKVFRADDPVFPGGIPPWDFNCRDRMRSLSQRQVDKGGLSVTDGSFLTQRNLPAPGFGGGEGPGGNLAGPAVKPIEPPEEPPAAPPEPPKAPPAPPPGPPAKPKAPRKPRRPRVAPPAPPPPPPAPPPAPPKAAPPEPKPAPPPPVAVPPPAAAAPTDAEPKKVSVEEAAAGFDDNVKVLPFNVGAIRVRGVSAAKHRETVYNALEEAGASKFFRTPQHQIRRVTITDLQRGRSATADQLDDYIPHGANGLAWHGASSPVIKILGRRPPPDNPTSELTKAWSVSESRKTEREMIRATTIHEFGHIVHLDGSGPAGLALQRQVDKVVEDRFYAVNKATISSDREELTTYARTNKDEYFAEAFAGYHLEPTWMKKHAPKAFGMVEDVLRLRGML